MVTQLKVDGPRPTLASGEGAAELDGEDALETWGAVLHQLLQRGFRGRGERGGNCQSRGRGPDDEGVRFLYPLPDRCHAPLTLPPPPPRRIAVRPPWDKFPTCPLRRGQVGNLSHSRPPWDKFPTCPLRRGQVGNYLRWTVCSGGDGRVPDAAGAARDALARARRLSAQAGSGPATRRRLGHPNGSPSGPDRLHRGLQYRCDPGPSRQELVCKRLLLPLCGTPEPLDPDRPCFDPMGPEGDPGKLSQKRLACPGAPAAGRRGGPDRVGEAD